MTHPTQLTPKEARAKWVEALRSGRYKQGRGTLRQKDSRGAYYYCCLGVACDVYRELTGKGHWREQPNGVSLWVSPNGTTEAAEPPSEVQVFFGVSNSSGHYGVTSLISANDNRGKSLSEIADIIEAEPEGLVLE